MSFSHFCVILAKKIRNISKFLPFYCPIFTPKPKDKKLLKSFINKSNSTKPTNLLDIDNYEINNDLLFNQNDEEIKIHFKENNIENKILENKQKNQFDPNFLIIDEKIKHLYNKKNEYFNSYSPNLKINYQSWMSFIPFIIFKQISEKLPEKQLILDVFGKVGINAINVIFNKNNIK